MANQLALAKRNRESALRFFLKQPPFAPPAMPELPLLASSPDRLLADGWLGRLALCLASGGALSSAQASAASVIIESDHAEVRVFSSDLEYSRFQVTFVGPERDTLRVEPVASGEEILVERSEDLREWNSVEVSPQSVDGDVVEFLIGAPSATAYYRITWLEPEPTPAAEAFVLIPAGSFMMGSPEDEPGRFFPEAQREITLTREYYISNIEVTWKLWNEVRDAGAARSYTDIRAGQNGENGDESGLHPVLGINWWDAIKWCNLRSELESKRPAYYASAGLETSNTLKTGTPNVFVDWNADGYRLPTEAEWEYAARAGTTTALYTGEVGVGSTDPNLDRAGWYRGNSDESTHPVGLKQPNDWGLYDMHGNASEWCWDWYANDPGPSTTDPTGASSGPTRSHRGGSWYSVPTSARSAARQSELPNISSNTLGFRVVRTATD